MNKTPKKTVIMLLETREHWGRCIAQGLLKSMHTIGRWVPNLNKDEEGFIGAMDYSEMMDSCGGVIGQFYPQHEALLKRLLELGLSVVNLSSEPPPAGVMWVHNDDEACGNLAAKHFLEQGYKEFACVGIKGKAFSIRRLEGYQTTLLAAGMKCKQAEDSFELRDYSSGEDMQQWLRSLPGRCALFASNDNRASHCLRAAEAAGIKVPDELAIVGADDDSLYCNMSNVPISSIIPNWPRIGERAMEMLEQCYIQPDSKNRFEEERIAPLGIQVRMSSDHVAIQDALTARALRYVKEHCESATTVDSLAAALGVSRRTLERHFERELGKGVRSVIMEGRLHRARELILQTRLSISEIAMRTGFSKHSHLNEVFKKYYGTQPSQLRK